MRIKVTTKFLLLVCVTLIVPTSATSGAKGRNEVFSALAQLPVAGTTTNVKIYISGYSSTQDAERLHATLLNGVSQRAGDRLLAHHVVEDLWTPFQSQHLVGHSLFLISLESCGSGALRHSRGSAYRCSLPGLTGFTGSARAGPEPQDSSSSRSDLATRSARSLGGGGGIRTHGTVSRTRAFRARQISHSCTPPSSSPRWLMPPPAGDRYLV